MSAGFTDRVAEFFKEHEGQWQDGRDLAFVGGCYAWRSRVSDCRRKFSMNIENRQRRVRKSDGTMFVVSEYRFCP